MNLAYYWELQGKVSSSTSIRIAILQLLTILNPTIVFTNLIGVWHTFVFYTLAVFENKNVTYHL